MGMGWGGEKKEEERTTNQTWMRYILALHGVNDFFQHQVQYVDDTPLGGNQVCMTQRCKRLLGLSIEFLVFDKD